MTAFLPCYFSQLLVLYTHECYIVSLKIPQIVRRQDDSVLIVATLLGENKAKRLHVPFEICIRDPETYILVFLYVPLN